MVPKEFRKSLCLVAGWITLLEAVVWEATSIYAIGVYSCTWDFFNIEAGTSTWSLLYISYFIGACKGNASAESLGYHISPPTDPARNLQIWMWIYSIVGAAWIPACILLIVATSAEVRGGYGALLYYPWVGLTAILVLLDLAGAVYHLVDIFSTTNPDDYATFMGSSNWTSLTSASSDGVLTWLPSLYVTLFFCRLLIIWLLNLFFVVGTYKASNAVSRYATKSLQRTNVMPEKRNCWKRLFYKGPDPSMSEHQLSTNSTNKPEVNIKLPAISQVPVNESVTERQEAARTRYRMDEFGIPIEEVNIPKTKEITYSKDEDPRSPYPSGRVFDFPEKSFNSEPTNRRHESVPPVASGVQIPPELNKFEPFSYIAGDQPQKMRKPVSRSGSHNEYPTIPHPDYTIADRRSASLEYVPNRFKVPSPKRSVQPESPGNLSRSPHSPRLHIEPGKKPQVYPRSTHDSPAMATQGRFISQQAMPTQAQDVYTRQTSQNKNYNIDRLY